jgi:hypothetical protein
MIPIAVAASTILIGAQARQSENKADFVDFQTFELDGEITNMLWCGNTDESILVQTDDGSIYRSRDRGSNWKRLKSLMTKNGREVADDFQEVSLLQA